MLSDIKVIYWILIINRQNKYGYPHFTDVESKEEVLFLFQSQDLTPSSFVSKDQALSFEMKNDQGEEMDDIHKRLRKHLNKAPAVPWSSSK